jgi:hypothetical protein
MAVAPSAKRLIQLRPLRRHRAIARGMSSVVEMRVVFLPQSFKKAAESVYLFVRRALF